MISRMNHFRRVHGIFLGILTVGIVLRLINIGEVGINHYDSAYYGNIAKVPILTADWYFNTEPDNRSLEDLGTYLKSRGATVNIIKPGHVLLISVSFFLFGINDVALVLVATLCGIGIIIVTYIIGCRLYSKEVGNMAAAIIAVSGQQLIFSRTGWPQTDTTLIFCVSLLFFWSYLSNNKRNRSFYVSAVLSGTLLLFHQSVYLVILPLFLLMVFPRSGVRQREVLSGFKDATIYFLVMLGIFIASKFAIHGINSLNPSEGTDLLARNYDRIFSTGVSYFGLSVERIVFFPKMFWKLEGGLFTILASFSIVYICAQAIMHRNLGYRILALIVWIPLIFWNINYTTLKAIHVVYPFLALSVGFMVVRAAEAHGSRWSRLLSKEIICLSVIGIILISGILRSVPILKYKSSYKPAIGQLIAYMAEHGGTLNSQQNNLWPILRFYLGSAVDTLDSDFKGQLEFDASENSDYQIVDWSQFVPGKNDINLLLETSANYDPLIRLPYAQEASPLWHYHRFYDVDRIPHLFDQYEDARYVSVYNVSGVESSKSMD